MLSIMGKRVCPGVGAMEWIENEWITFFCNVKLIINKLVFNFRSIMSTKLYPEMSPEVLMVRIPLPIYGGSSILW